MKKYFFILIFVAGIPEVYSQGSFQNLNFEAASNLPVVSQGQSVQVPASDALPGWTVYEDGSQVSQVWYNGVSAGSALVTLVGPNTGYPGSGMPALSGNYSATVDDGEGNFDLAAAAIAQVGLVPGTAKSMQFIAAGNVSDVLGFLGISFAGHNLPIITLANGASYNHYGVDISQFSGQTGELRFTEYPTARAAGVTYLDNITFSQQVVPEPSTWMLLLCGATVMGAARFSSSKFKV